MNQRSRRRLNCWKYGNTYSYSGWKMLLCGGTHNLYLRADDLSFHCGLASNASIKFRALATSKVTVRPTACVYGKHSVKQRVCRRNNPERKIDVEPRIKYLMHNLRLVCLALDLNLFYFKLCVTVSRMIIILPYYHKQNFTYISHITNKLQVNS